jgi:ribosomal protein S8
MEKLFNVLNIGYMTNAQKVKVVFKKKYIFILEKLLKINCIQGFTFDENFIFIKLRYYKNKPLFFFLMKSKSGNKIYKNFIKKLDSAYHLNLSLFFTDKGLLTIEETFLKKVGGEFVVDILFLDKK